MQIKGVVFDWSGTLSDDLRLVYEAAMHIFDRLHRKHPSFAEFKQELVIPYMDFYRKYFPRMKKADRDRWFLEAIQKVGEPVPFAGIDRLLWSLREQEKRLAVLSSVHQIELLSEASQYGFLDHFEELNGGVHDKTEALAEIMDRRRLMPQEVAYVGDMVHDIEVGRQAGVITVAVSWGYDSRKKLLNARPDHIVNSVEELESLLNS
ncbi:MAG TPA: HAD family hydrolase [Candidatus Nanoarchaeia archaeon]|nr:HAD family hydrolase [Candidatus Nanoarchaeia archaeon]